MENLLNRHYEKINLIYSDKNKMKKRCDVKLIFSDNKVYYFSSDYVENFVLPAKNSEVEIQIYTPNGIYSAKTKVKNTEFHHKEKITFEVQFVDEWKLINLRKSSRVKVSLPIVLSFSDNRTLTTVTEDISLGGVSFFTKETISAIDKRLACDLLLKLPEELAYSFPNGELKVSAKYVKEKTNIDGHFEEIFYAFKFLNITKEEQDILKDFLIKSN